MSVKRITHALCRIGRAVGTTSQEDIPFDPALIATMIEDIADIIEKNPGRTISIQKPKTWHFEGLIREE